MIKNRILHYILNCNINSIWINSISWLIIYVVDSKFLFDYNFFEYQIGFLIFTIFLIIPFGIFIKVKNLVWLIPIVVFVFGIINTKDYYTSGWDFTYLLLSMFNQGVFYLYLKLNLPYVGNEFLKLLILNLSILLSLLLNSIVSLFFPISTRIIISKFKHIR